MALVSTVPSASAVVWFTFAYENLQQNPYAMAAIAGMVAAAIGLMLGASIQLIRPHLHQWTRTVFICLAAFVLGGFLKWPPVWILLVGGVLGVLWRPVERVP